MSKDIYTMKISLSLHVIGGCRHYVLKNGEDYFIAGRSLNRWVICGSIMSTNVAAVYLVGPAGRAYEEAPPP